jgi:hypothetical protein
MNCRGAHRRTVFEVRIVWSQLQDSLRDGRLVFLSALALAIRAATSAAEEYVFGSAGAAGCWAMAATVEAVAARIITNKRIKISLIEGETERQQQLYEYASSASRSFFGQARQAE